MVKNSIKVYARLKKEDDRKKTAKYQIYRRPDHEDISFPASSTTDVTQKSRKYRFSKVFDQVTTQADIFATVAVPIINSVINGFNGTIFAYGQTGSGKTYTITGSPTEYNQRGILPRSIEQIFELTKIAPSLYNIYVSYLEIYNEIGYDLLNSKHQPSKLEELPRVVLLEDANGEAHLRNLCVCPVANEQEAMRLLFLGDTNRTIAETPMNEYSSRSHCIFTIYINSRSGEKLRRSKLHLVDLAGSERICKANISGVTLKEAKHINLSLHYLEQVILALSQSNRTHIPYRNSMMTYILKDSLSGNSLTVMLATLALTKQNQPETLTTCRFSQRVACISTDANINEEVDPQQEIEFLRAEVDELRRQLVHLKGENHHEPLTPEDTERCRKIADNFLWSKAEHLPDNLNCVDLRCCLSYLKSRVADKLNDEAEKQRIEEDARLSLTTEFNAIIKEKDEEISVLTQLLQIGNHKVVDNQRTSSAPACSTKLQLPMSEHVLSEVDVDNIAQIKRSLSKKYDLARNAAKTVLKCQDNIKDIRQKLTREKIGTEVAEKLHTFLISQQKIYKESLDYLENLKSETEFLKESLKQAENKVMINFKRTIAAKHKPNKRDEMVENQQKVVPDYQYFSSGKSLKQLSLEVADEEIPPFEGLHPENVASSIRGVNQDLGEYSLLNAGIKSSISLTKSGTSSGYTTPKSGGEEPSATFRGDKGASALFKNGDTPEFMEFMKTIPLTGDLEVDDEIFNFYRTKFKH